MTIIQVPVTAIQLGSGIYTAGLFLQNQGVTTLYVSTTNPGVSPTSNDRAIGPGGNWTSPPGSPIYIVSAPGVGSLAYGPAGSDFNSGSTFAQSSNAPVLLSSGDLPFTVAAHDVSTTLQNIDLTPFASIYVVLSLVSPIIITPQGAGTAGNPYAIMGAVIYQSSLGTFPTIPPDCRITSPQWLITANPGLLPGQSIQVPVERSNAAITIYSQWGIGKVVPTAGVLHYDIYGSNETIPETEYISQGWGMNGSIHIGGFYNKTLAPGAGTVTELVATKNNDSTLGFIGTGGNCQVSFIETGIVIPAYFAEGSSISATGSVTPMKLPLRPVQIATTVSATVNAAIVTLTQ